METNNDVKQSESATTEPGKAKLQIRTARIQKYITVDENISVKDVSIYISSSLEKAYQVESY